MSGTSDFCYQRACYRHLIRRPPPDPWLSTYSGSREGSGCSEIFQSREIISKLLGAACPAYTLQLYLCFDILSTATVGFIKLSALLFYKRIFCPHWSGLTITIYVFTAIVTLYTILFMIILPTQCGLDLSVLWAPDPQLSKARCNSGHSVARVEAWVICDAILDAIIIAMPLPSVLSRWEF